MKTYICKNCQKEPAQLVAVLVNGVFSHYHCETCQGLFDTKNHREYNRRTDKFAKQVLNSSDHTPKTNVEQQCCNVAQRSEKVEELRGR